jgi:hypothetical protein
MKVELRKFTHSPALSRETIAFTADLYIDGEKVGRAMNDGGGGSNHLTMPLEYHKKLNDHTAALPPHKSNEYGEFPMDTDLFISLLAEDMIARKDNLRIVKKGKRTAFQLTSTKPDSWHLVDMPFNQRTKELLKDKFGDKLVRILNEEMIAKGELLA